MQHHRAFGPSDDSAIHYDAVTSGWQFVMGNNLHYGLFTNGCESLAEATRNLTTRLAETAGLTPNDVVLDVGCGVGGPALQLAQDVGCRVVGISTSESGIELAHTAAEGSPAGGLTSFQHGDALAMPFDNNTFDVVWVLESSHLMRNKRRLFLECARVLRPGGRFVLCDIIVPVPLGMGDILKHAKQFVLLKRVYGRAKMEPLGNYANWARAAGFSDVRTQDISRETRSTFTWWRKNAEVHRSDISSKIGSDARSEFAESCSVLADFWDRGILGYGIVWGTLADPR